jgi:ABC-type multidrug transport system fused ATPase/permease subunit
VTDPARAILWAALRRQPYQLVRLAGWSVAETAPAFIIGLAIARAIDDGFAAGRPGVGLSWLALLGSAWLVAAVGARQVVLAVAAIVEPFREDLLRHLVAGALRRLPTSGRAPGTAVVARLNLQVELARDAFAAVIMVIRSFAFTVVSVVLGLLSLTPELLPLVLPPLAVGLGLFLVSLPALARRQRAAILADERTTEAVAALAGGLRDIAACGAEDRVGDAISGQVREQADAGRALARVTAGRTAALAVGGWLPVLLVLGGAPWLLRGGAGPGVVLGALAYVMQSLVPVFGSLVQGLGVNGVRLTVTLDRILDQGDGPGPPVTEVPEPMPSRADLSLRRATFAYGPHAEPVIDGLDLFVPEGDHLAVVGPSGIGKSTLAALITGVLEPHAGKIAIGGIRADRVDRADRVLIPQEAYVFRGPLWENLTYLAGASRVAVDAAVGAVGMEGLVDRVGGYSAEVNPVTLSAGERQLIALTRAYLAPARLVILDEATCHLDPAAEARAETAFACRDSTLVVVAHRLTSALRARRVLVMDGTRVLLGTHEEMIAVSPLYADLAGQWQPVLVP